MKNELTDGQIIELAELNSIRMKTGAGAIKLARAVIEADRAQWHEAATFVMGGDKIYWPLSPEDADRLHESCCGEGRFDGPNVAEIAALKAERDVLLKDAGKVGWVG